MEAVKNGELQQASVLFARYHKRIFNFLRQYLNDTMLAEDLTQNVFLRLIKYRSSYREGSDGCGVRASSATVIISMPFRQ